MAKEYQIGGSNPTSGKVGSISVGADTSSLDEKKKKKKLMADTRAKKTPAAASSTDDVFSAKGADPGSINTGNSRPFDGVTGSGGKAPPNSSGFSGVAGGGGNNNFTAGPTGRKFGQSANPSGFTPTSNASANQHQIASAAVGRKKFSQATDKTGRGFFDASAATGDSVGERMASSRVPSPTSADRFGALAAAGENRSSISSEPTSSPTGVTTESPKLGDNTGERGQLRRDTRDGDGIDAIGREKLAKIDAESRESGSVMSRLKANRAKRAKLKEKHKTSPETEKELKRIKISSDMNTAQDEADFDRRGNMTEEGKANYSHMTEFNPLIRNKDIEGARRRGKGEAARNIKAEGKIANFNDPDYDPKKRKAMRNRQLLGGGVRSKFRR